MTDAKHYSLWLMPTGAVRDELGQWVANLSREFSAPLFPPHVTLIGGLSGSEEDLSAATRDLAARLRPYVVQLGEVDYLDEFYRSLFIRVEKTSDVLDANAHARALFHRENDAGYMPHLSLLYGNFEREVKEKIVARIGKRLDLSFNVTALYLYSTLGDTKEWYQVCQAVVK